MAATSKPEPSAPVPWQQRVLESLRIKKKPGAAPASPTDCAATGAFGPAATDEEAAEERDHFFLPRFQRTPKGNDWS